MAGVTLIGAPIVGAIASLVTEQNPGRLSIELGMSIFFFGILAVATRPLILQLLSIDKADAEIAVIRALFLAIWASVVLVLLGILNLMRIIPWR